MDNKMQFINTTVIDNKAVQNQYQFEDDMIYIIVTNSMVFISDVNFDELNKLIDDEEYEEIEAYDLTDEEAYFLENDDLEDSVKYAITETLIAYIRRIKK